MPTQMNENKGNKLSVEIAGGLGNQLFMFYGGLFLGEFLGREVKYDTSSLAKITRRHPGLDIQGLGFLQQKDIEFKFYSWLRKVLWKLKKGLGDNFLNGKLLPSFFCVGEIGFVDPHTVPFETRFLKGYFQSWKYFELLPDKPILNHDCLPAPSIWFKEMINEIEKRKPAVIHVRRGDYRFAENQSIGLLSTKYYEDAISFLDHSKQIWIFSDSPDSVETELKGLNRNLVFIRPPNESDPVESLLLMSLAPEIVISNSTFSWWAAFLSRGNSRVFAPTKWYKSQPDPIDLIPSNWLRIESKWIK